MKIEDGFNDAPSVHETRPVRTEKTFGVGAMMTFAAVVLLAGVLGFLGGMQVNKIRVLRRCKVASVALET